LPADIALVSMFSRKLCMFAGILNSTQCTQVPIGASGSSTVSAKDCVLAGGSFHASAGEMFFPTHEYFAGMDCPFANASLVKVRDMVASVADDSDSDVGSAEGWGVVVAEEVQAARIMELNIKLLKMIRFILNFLFLPG